MDIMQIASQMENITSRIITKVETKPDPDPGTGSTAAPVVVKENTGLKTTYEVRYVEEILTTVVQKAEPNQTVEV